MSKSRGNGTIDSEGSMEGLLSLFDPTVAQWFGGKFTDFTPPQARALPLIKKGRSTLITSPTGSGKTLTAFLSIMDELIKLGKEDRLENRVYCVYISPLRALANDIEKNLKVPLKEIGDLAKKQGDPLPDIRVNVRSGDTSLYQRQKMSKKAPHILITTPETLSIVLSTTRFSQNLTKVRWVIVDEIHEMCSSKRGSHLAVSLERLQDLVGRREFVRVGLSATLSPVKEVSSFLGGRSGNGRERPVETVEIQSSKDLDLKILCPALDLNAKTQEEINEKVTDLLINLIKKHSTTIVFCNTRAGAETTHRQLEARGLKRIGVHHGSLSREIRMETEEALRAGKLDAVITSTSLELGIDIGSVDLVVQMGSPRSISKFLQRVGRAGHSHMAVSKGRLIATDRDDLVECAVLVHAARKGILDPVEMVHNPMDVLAQSLVGMSLERRWSLKDALRTLRRSYPFYNLRKKDMESVLQSLSGRESLTEIGVYGKLWYDPKKSSFGIKRGVRPLYFMNAGMIVQEGSFGVRSFATDQYLGNLSERFVENLHPGAVFLLGGKTYEFMKFEDSTVFVREVWGKRPTVPSWTGEMLPRSLVLSREVGWFRDQVARRVSHNDRNSVIEWLQEEFGLDDMAADTVHGYFSDQMSIQPEIPSQNNMLVEGYTDGHGVRHAIVHLSLGSRANEALARGWVRDLMERCGRDIRFSTTDDHIVIDLPPTTPMDDVIRPLDVKRFTELVQESIKDTVLFRQRFKEAAQRSLLVLRQSGGSPASTRQLFNRTRILMERFGRVKGFFVTQEVFREIMEDHLDMETSAGVLEDIRSGRLSVTIMPFSQAVTPFAHGAVLNGIFELSLMPQRQTLIHELDRKTLSRILSQSELAKPAFTHDEIASHFDRGLSKVPPEERLDMILDGRGFVTPPMAAEVVGDSSLAKRLLDDLGVRGACCRMWLDGEVVVHGRYLDDFLSWATHGTYQDRDGYRLPPEVADREPDQKLEGDVIARLQQDMQNNLAICGGPADLAGSWQAVPPPPYPPYESALQNITLRLLEWDGPASAGTLAGILGVEEDWISTMLQELVIRGKLTSGSFRPPEGQRQYMMLRDLMALEEGKDDRSRLVSETRVRSFRHHTECHHRENLKEYIRDMAPLPSEEDLFYRLGEFSEDEWHDLQRFGMVIKGRFLGGRPSFIHRDDLALWVGSRRRSEPDVIGRRVLEELGRIGNMARTDIFKRLPVTRTRLMDSIDSLERNLFIHRWVDLDDGEGRRVRYALLRPDNIPDDAFHQLVLKTVRSHGPMHINRVGELLDMPLEEVFPVVEDLKSRDLITTVIQVGEAPIELLTVKDAVEAMSSFRPARSRLDLFPATDPFTQRYSTRARVLFGGIPTHVMLRDGVLIGALHADIRSGHVEVRDLWFLQSRVRDALDVLGRLMDYTEPRGFRVTRILKVNDKPPDELSRELVRALDERGYRKKEHSFIRGDVDPGTYSDADIMGVILHSQHVHPKTHLDNANDLVTSMMGIRSDFEVRLRVTSKFYGIRDFARNNDLIIGKMLGDTTLTCAWDDVVLYHRARGDEPDELERYILDRLPDNHSLPTKNLAERLNLDPYDFDRVRKDLIEKLFVIKEYGNRLRKIPDPPDISVEEARLRVVQRHLGSFGIASVKNLKDVLRPMFDDRDIRSILVELERRGEVVKGFFHRDRNTLMWTTTSARELLGNVRFTASFVLTPDDRLHTFIHRSLRHRMGPGTHFLIFRGPTLSATFKAQARGTSLYIREFRGKERDRKVLNAFLDVNELSEKWQTGGDDDDEDDYEDLYDDYGDLD